MSDDKTDLDWLIELGVREEMPHDLLLEQSRRELEALREFAKRYGSHLPNCPNPYKRECECGYNQDRAALKGV